MNIHRGDKIQTTIGSTDNRKGVVVEAFEIQTGIEQDDLEIRGPSILKRGGYGKKHYVVPFNKIQTVL